jgi:two-component system, NtrC family, sensor kinase
MSSTVLIVDDSLTVRMNLAEAFEAAGETPVLASSVASAREALARRNVELVILDVVLPDGDGIDLLSEIRRAPETQAVPILLLSSEADVKDRVRGLKRGADDYVGKPYEVDYVVARARELLRGKRRAATPDRPLVLVIDDSDTYREALRAALDGAGYDVATATSGEEGLRIAAAERPAAILVDSVMPGIDGATVIRKVRLDAALRGTPCVLLTASEDKGAELRALDAGADVFVRKEEPLTVVLARLAAALRSAGLARADTATLLGPKRILAVDDSPTYLHELAAILRGEGYDVILARSGEEALDLLAVQAVDCILLDVMMPGLDGRQTCQRIKASPYTRDLPLMLLTAMDDQDAMIAGLGTGADDFISKSGDVSVLKARVRAQLRRKQFEDEHRRIRDDLLRSELRASEERAARAVAEAKAGLVEELQRKNKELEAFSYSVSHDLRAPLRSVDGFSQALLDDCSDQLNDTGRRHLQRVRAAAQRMGELIEALLDLSRVSRAELSREEVNVSEVARIVADELQRKEPERRVDVAITPDVIASADRRLLRVVLENLLGNAWKFTSKTATPHVRLERVEAKEGAAETVFAVRDNGAGFSMEYATRLFAPFQRLHRETDFPGTGIGLATVYRVVDRHGGRVWAESALDQGTSIYVGFPSRASRGDT